MWTQKRKNGTYRFFESYKDPLTGKRKQISLTSKKNTRIARRQAQIVLERRISKALKSANPEHINPRTLAQVMKEWEPIYKSRVKKATWEGYRCSKKGLLRFFDPNILVNRLTPRLCVRTFENMLYKYNCGNGAVLRDSVHLRLILRFAFKRAYTSTPPAQWPIRWKPHRTGKIQDKFLEDDEVSKVLRYMRKHSGNREADALLWQYLTGMRMGEVMALQVKNLHKTDGKWFADVTGTMTYANLTVSEYYKATPKTKNAYRSVFLPKEAVILAQRYSKGKKPNDFLFADHNGHLFSLISINTALRNAGKTLGIHKPLSTHIFRHTHVSKLAELGVPLYIIQERVGHGDSAVTRDVYLHVTRQARKKYDKLIEKL